MISSDVLVLEAAMEHESTSDVARKAFEDMLQKGRPLTDAQRAWATAASRGERYEPEEKYLNMVSAGTVPRGREVELMVRDKPLRPPGRRNE